MSRKKKGFKISSRVNTSPMSRLVLDAHGCRCNARRTAAPLIKLGVHIWLLAGFLTLLTILFPQQRQGHARPGQFTVDVRIVGFGATGYVFCLGRKAVPVRRW